MTAPLLAYYKDLQQRSQKAAGGAEKSNMTVVAEFQGTESDVIYKGVKPFLMNDMKLATV
jgi:hypothetical protein